MLSVEFRALFDYRTTHRVFDMLISSFYALLYSIQPKPIYVHSFIDYVSLDSASILISIRYDFHPWCLLRKVMEATDAVSVI